MSSAEFLGLMTNLSSSATQVQMLLSRDPSAAISAGVPSECLQALSATLQAVLAATESTQRLAAASASLCTPSLLCFCPSSLLCLCSSSLLHHLVSCSPVLHSHARRVAARPSCRVHRDRRVCCHASCKLFASSCALCA